jgi:hypothetical protein
MAIPIRENTPSASPEPKEMDVPNGHANGDDSGLGRDASLDGGAIAAVDGASGEAGAASADANGQERENLDAIEAAQGVFFNRGI